MSIVTGFSISTPYESLSVLPLIHSAKPPKIDLVAEPEPLRANFESSFEVSCNPAALLAAAARAAKPEADEAKPADVGTLL